MALLSVPHITKIVRNSGMSFESIPFGCVVTWPTQQLSSKLEEAVVVYQVDLTKYLGLQIDQGTWRKQMTRLQKPLQYINYEITLLPRSKQTTHLI